jgi:hypothetical protein
VPITYDPIATTTLSTATRSITFSSIPATYTDLRIVLVASFQTQVDYFEVTFNGTTTGYSWTYVQGDGSNASSGRISNNTKWVPNFPTGAGSTTIPMLSTTDIFSYAGSTFKSGLMETSANISSSGQVIRTVGLWRNTDAITSIKLEVQTYNWNAGTIATLYGIKNA